MDGIMDLQDASPLEISTVGVRKPRSGSVRKPRSGAHAVVTFDQEPTVSPLSGSPGKLNSWNEGSRFSSRDSDPMQAYFGDPVSERSSHAEKVKETLKESVDIWGHGYPNRMAEGEQRTELRMFQRRERKRDDDKTHNRDTSRPSSKSWKDYDASDRNFGRDDARWSGGSSYEVSKKPKDSMERPDKSWRERDSSEKRHKDGFHRERDDHGVNSSWHKSKGLHDRERNEYSHQNRDHRDRGDPSHPTHKDWKAKGYPRDKDYERGDRVHDSKDGSHKSRSVNANADAPERHSSHQVYTSKSDRSSHNHDCESPSHHRHLSSGRSSQVDQAHVENSSWNKNSSHHSSRGPDKSVDASNAVPGGDSRSIPKLKLKVGGITHTLNSEGRRQSEGGDSVARTSHQSGTSHKKRMSSAPEPNRRRQRLILQDDSDEDDDIPSSGKERTHASDEDGFLAYLAEEPVYHRGSGGIAHEGNQLSQGVRKSSRVPKKRVFDGDDDVEAEPKKKRKKKAELDSDEDLYRIEEDELEHGFAEEEEEELEMANDKMKLNKRRRKSLDVDLSVNDDRRVGLGAGKLGIPGESKGGVPLTARQRALQSSKEGLAFNEGPALHALLVLLRTICLEHRKVEYAEKCLEMLAIDQRILEEPSLSERSKVLPFILSILVPVLRKKREGMQQCFPLEAAVCKWLEIANSAGPLNAYSELVPDMEHILQVVVSCFPLHTAGGSAAIIAASSSIVSQREKALLLRLMQKEVSGVGSFVANASKSYAMAHDNCPKINDAKLLHEEILAKLVASSVVYCWKDFTNQEWVLVLSHMRKWLEAALLEAEKVREIFKDAGMQGADKPTDSALTILNRINEEMQRSHSKQTDLSWTAVILFSIVHSLEGYNSVEPSTSLEHLISNWREAKHRALSYIVRIFFASGMAESLALDSAAGEVAANLIANSRKSDLGFWENVSEIILSSSKEERIEIARHLNMWTVGKDPVRSLYAMLFSSEPIGGLQHTAYSLLTSVPFQNSAISAVARGDIVDTSTEELNTEQSPLNAAYLRDELSVVLETCTSTISESSLTSPIRVKYFLAWAIVLSHLRLVSVLSPVGEKLVQYIQDSSLSSNLLESIFEHIPLKSGSASSHRKKTSASVWHAEVQKAGDAAKRACTLGSVSSMVDGLWPIEEGSISCLAAGLYGLLLQVLPACVRVWFTGLRDRSLAGSIESFTSKFCSPHLLAEEFSQVHNTTTTDDTLIIKANQSLGEVVVLYKKEEAGMDMVVKMPKCYPLRAVDIDCTRRLGISETRLRKWMLSMAAFLRNQNGAVAEAIQIWRQNVDREFEGVEECPICYSILHTVNHSLPRLACKTCKHKFHSACLYKWFSTSHKSTCPLCQTPF